MALINREELLKAFGLSEKTRKYGGDHSGYSTWMLYEIQDTIEEAEEVEAIPVDWLLRKAEWCDKDNKIFTSGAIRYAVDAWREEQNERV